MAAAYSIIQWIWGFPQTAAGAVISLFVGGKAQRFHGASVRRWRLSGSVSLGRFIFISEKVQPEFLQRIMVHEYGHTIQSLFLGPLYLLAVGIPSVLWAGLPALEKYRINHSVSYYSFYSERWADELGERYAK